MSQSGKDGNSIKRDENARWKGEKAKSMCEGLEKHKKGIIVDDGGWWQHLLG